MGASKLTALAAGWRRRTGRRPRPAPAGPRPGAVAAAGLLAAGLLAAGPASADPMLAGRWTGHQGVDREVLVTLILRPDGSGEAEFRRIGSPSTGRAEISGLAVEGSRVRYSQHYERALDEAITGSTADLSLTLSVDGRAMVGEGVNRDSGRRFATMLIRR